MLRSRWKRRDQGVLARYFELLQHFYIVTSEMWSVNSWHTLGLRSCHQLSGFFFSTNVKLLQVACAAPFQSQHINLVISDGMTMTQWHFYLPISITRNQRSHFQDICDNIVLLLPCREMRQIIFLFLSRPDTVIFFCTNNFFIFC